MNTSNMSNSTRNLNINIYKSQLRSVIANLKLLEDCRAGVDKILEQQELLTLINKTTNLLEELEAAPTAKICLKIEKRRRKRQSAKLRRKLRQATTKSISSSTIPQVKLIKHPEHTLTEASITKERSNLGTQKLHQQLRSYYDSTQFLRSFELLELLHSARSQDVESTRNFASELSRLRTIWNVIRRENKPEYTTAQDVQHQWTTVLFGAQEKSYYKKERNFNDLLCVRRKWDSYLTNNKKLGSSIPNGWVLPPENPDERWQRYQTKFQDPDLI